MGDILSLSKARKAKARVVKEQQAVENRIRFGRTKAEKLLENARREKDALLIDAHKKDDE